MLKSNHWTNKYGVFKKNKTTTAGNCFFSSLLASKLFDFQCEEDARRILVERIRNDEFLYFSVWKWHVGRGTQSDYRKHVEKLSLSGTWAKDCDLYFAAIAYKVDLISINELDLVFVVP